MVAVRKNELHDPTSIAPERRFDYGAIAHASFT